MEKSIQQKNKDLVLKAFDTLFNKRDYATAETFWSPKYVQHDFGPVPMSPKLHIDLVDDTITDAGDRKKIFSTNTLALLRLAESAPRLVPRAA